MILLSAIIIVLSLNLNMVLVHFVLQFLYKFQDDLLCLTYSTGERYHLLGLRDSISALKDRYMIPALPKGENE